MENSNEARGSTKRTRQEENTDDSDHDSTNTQPANKYQCETKPCNHSSNRSFNMDRHKETWHKPSKKELSCCGEKFNTLFEYVTHKKDMKHDENGFNCGTCGLNFKRLPTLKRHMLVHSGVKNFKCELDDCSLASNSKDNILRHQHSVHKVNNAYSARQKNKCNPTVGLPHLPAPDLLEQSQDSHSLPWFLTLNNIRLMQELSAPLDFSFTRPNSALIAPIPRHAIRGSPYPSCTITRPISELENPIQGLASYGSPNLSRTATRPTSAFKAPTPRPTRIGSLLPNFTDVPPKSAIKVPAIRIASHGYQHPSCTVTRPQLELQAPIPSLGYHGSPNNPYSIIEQELGHLRSTTGNSFAGLNWFPTNTLPPAAPPTLKLTVATTVPPSVSPIVSFINPLNFPGNYPGLISLEYNNMQDRPPQNSPFNDD